MKKFDWLASESAPKYYPMKILKGDFIYPETGSLYIPNGKRVDGGWGTGVSTHVVGPDLKPLPTRMEITYFSYTEDKFYTGAFDLPYERILQLFQQGYFSPSFNRAVTYHYIIAGIAPGGTVSVWVSGIDRSIEVFSGKAKETEIEWDVFIGEKFHVPRKGFLEMAIDEELTPEAQQSLKQNGVPVGLWDKYHQSRYLWKLVLTDMKLRDDRTSRNRFYNGEQDYLNVEPAEDAGYQDRAIPKRMSAIWKPTDYLKNDLVIDIAFDEQEIFNAFESIGKNNTPMEMEFRMEPEKNYDFTIWLRNDKNSIELKKTGIKTRKPGGMRYKDIGPNDTE